MGMQTQIPQTLPIDAVAERLGVSPWTVRTWLRQGRVAHFKLGKRVLVKVEDVESLLSQNYRPAVRPTGPTSTKAATKRARA
ncbi:MAG TPA: helix-turn-helix domain-containing protein [Methylomirabilota bacterium]|nr:helix-turn-helix domain-containing protein [Methylomirabilota bacterium]